MSTGLGDDRLVGFASRADQHMQPWVVSLLLHLSIGSAHVLKKGPWHNNNNVKLLPCVACSCVWNLGPYPCPVPYTYTYTYTYANTGSLCE